MREQGQIPRTCSNRDRRVKRLRLEVEGMPILRPSDVPSLRRDSDALERFRYYSYRLRMVPDALYSELASHWRQEHGRMANHYLRILEGAGVFTAGCRR